MIAVENLIEIEDLYQDKNEQQIKINHESYHDLMFLYTLALKEIEKKINIIKYDYKYLYDYDYIDHIKTRIKKPESIIKKLKQKHCSLTYQNLVREVNDVAGIRIVCPLRDDIFKVKEMISEFPDVEIIKQKDYITNPKKSGYSSYHLIIKVPVYIKEDAIRVKVEMQIRTMAMDFWASLEHGIQYKPNGRVKDDVSKELKKCADIIESLDRKMVDWCMR